MSQDQLAHAPRKRALFGIFSAILTIIVLITSYSDITMFIDLPSLLIVAVFIPTSALVINPHKHGLSFTELYTLYPYTEEKALNAAKYFSRLGWLLVEAGILGFFIGLVIILSNLSDPINLGPALGVALMTIVYGMLLKMICSMMQLYYEFLANHPFN